MRESSIDREVSRVVESGNCSGCGACCLLDAGLRMRLDANGYARPIRVAPARPGTVTAPFERICPGAVVVAPQRRAGELHNDALGSASAAWQAWATDPEVRFRGSSGGVLTAIVRWLLESGEASEAVEAVRDRNPRRTVTVALRTPSDVIEAAGSRYAPVSNAARAVLGKKDAVFVGKPCEVAAVRALARESGLDAPLLVSFFCAGTPSQAATDRLVDELAEGRQVADLWYRGHGWPGHFTVTTSDGTTATRSYDESWGSALGPSMQWRCKVCPDGVGESADIVAADYWESDADGYPVFEEGEGVSAVLARTPRGLEVLRRAFAAGVLDGSDLDLDALAAVQPLQVERRRTLFARGVGVRLAGRRMPRFRGFGLFRLSPKQPREFARIVLGTYRRIRSGRAAG